MAERPFLRGAIIGGALGNVLGGVCFLLVAWLEHSVVFLILGLAAFSVGGAIYTTMRED